MLGRVAGNLFWSFRYLERAENMARFVDAGLRISMVHSGARNNEWMSVLDATGCRNGFIERHGEIEQSKVMDYLLRDKSNPSSVLACFERARINARLARTALTREVWENLNESWLRLQAAFRPQIDRDEIADLLRMIRQHCQLVQGAMNSTMLRNDIFGFASLGMLVERADATARTIDVKYYVLLPSIAQIGTPVDNVQWQTLLRATSSERAYNWVHGGEVSAPSIARFLMLDRSVPRSLAYCYDAMLDAFEPVCEGLSEEPESLRLARSVNALLAETDIENVFEDGLHDFLSDFIAQNNRLGMLIERDFRFVR